MKRAITWPKVISVISASRKAIRPSSRRLNQSSRMIGPLAGAARRLFVGLLRGGDQVLADIVFELRPDGRHRLAPRGEVILREFLDLRLAGVGDQLLVALVDVVGKL